MRTCSICLCCFLYLQLTAATSGTDIQWQTPKRSSTSSKSLLHIKGEASSDNARDFSFDIIRIDPKQCTPIIVSNSPDNKLKAKAWAQKRNALACINGSYFTTEFKSDGLLKIAGTIKQPISNKKIFSGIIRIEQNSTINIQKGSDASKATHAMQSGPIVIEKDGSLGIHRKNNTYAQRSLIGLDAKQNIVLIRTSPITLYELGDFLKQQQKALQIDGLHQVINLDGGPISGLYAQEASILCDQAEQRPGLSYLVFLKKNPSH